MFVVAGATGRVGSATAHGLLAAGAAVRVLVRRPAAVRQWADRGADARVLDLSDRAALTSALTGANGVFLLLPFNLTVPGPEAHSRVLVAAAAGAVADAGVPRVVVLSSGGADLSTGTGPVVGLHHLEESLRKTGTTVTALRSGHFQEKVVDVLDVARRHGVYPVFAASADVPRAMGATRDIGAVAARALLSPPSSNEVVDVLGPDHTEREVAGVLGTALGRRLEVVPLPEDAWESTLRDTGLPSPAAAALAELYRADERGLLAPRGDRSVRLTTPVEHTVAGLVTAAVVPR